MKFLLPSTGLPRWLRPTLTATGIAMALAALFVSHKTREAQRRHPPAGRFMAAIESVASAV